MDWQWREQVIPYWTGLVKDAQDVGVERLCLELHGQQCVYNVSTLMRLCDAVGPVVGANFDPSHLFWMGADPVAALQAVGEAVYHVHAKDTRIEDVITPVNGLIDVTPMTEIERRAWRYVTLGDGHGADWWRGFLGALHDAGYDGVLSIEHEDRALAPLEGVQRSVALLQSALRTQSARGALPM